MSLVKPSTELARLQDEMERFFGRTFGGLAPFTGIAPFVDGAWSPSVDVQESNGNLIIKADLPGIKKEDVEITALEESIRIEGRTSQEHEEKQDHFYRRERQSGYFLRVVPLPMPVDVSKNKAEFKDGTLTITFPKLSEAPKGQKIDVN